MKEEKTITLKPAKSEVKIRVDSISGEEYEEIEITEAEQVVTPPVRTISKQQLTSEIVELDRQIGALNDIKTKKQELLNKFTR